MSTEKIIQVDQIPDLDMKALGQYVLDATQNYFFDPQHQKEFEAWQKKQHKKNTKIPKYQNSKIL